MEIGAAGKRARVARIAGTTRAISTSSSMRRCPGRVDSPPKSKRSAPNDHCSTARKRGRLRVFDSVAGERVRGNVYDGDDVGSETPSEARAPHLERTAV